VKFLGGNDPVRLEFDTCQPTATASVKVGAACDYAGISFPSRRYQEG
jgi:hypothetical protein